MKASIHLLFFILFVAFFPQLKAQNLFTRHEPLPCLNKEFTIVAHVVRDSMWETNLSDGELLGAIDSLNVKFAPICVSFEVCEINIIDNFQYDDVEENSRKDDWEEMLDKFYKENRINVFFVTSMDQAEECGFAEQEGLLLTEPNAIAILKGDCLSTESQAIAHQMGHYFGLLHTSEGQGVELVSGANCSTAGDLICDTPADPFVMGDDPADYVDVALGCRFISNKVDADGRFYEPDVGNIMSLYQKECQCGFTHEQYLRMAQACREAANGLW